MSAQFIRGTAVADLEAPLIQATKQWLEEDAQHEVFYSVPNHIKFEQEIQVLQRLRQLQMTTSDSVISTRLQVFSSYRLTWYYLQHAPFYSADVLSDAGAAVIFRKILVEAEEELRIFRGGTSKPGFTQQLFQLCQEMCEGNIEIAELYSLLEKQTENPKGRDLQLKSQNLTLIFMRFQLQMSQYGYESTEIIQHLSEYPQTVDSPNVRFVISGYRQSTARGLKLVEVPMMQAGSVKVALLLDKQYPHDLFDLWSLLYEAGQTYHQLYQLARQKQIPILSDYVEKKEVLITNPDLQGLNDYWIQLQEYLPPLNIADWRGDGLFLWRAENIEEELIHAATEIHRLVVGEGYRCKEIRVLTRDLNCYENLLEPIFAEHEIPVYVDRDMAMDRHSLVEWVESLFAIHSYNYRYRDVLCLLRMELSTPMNQLATSEESLTDWLNQRNVWRRKVDIIENVVLAYGHEGYYWSQEKDWEFIRYDSEAEEQEDVVMMEEESNAICQSL